MRRPFYVHTPRNVLGESLVHWSNNIQYEIRSYYTGAQVWARRKYWDNAKVEAEWRNDEHEVEMARAMYI